MLSILIPIYNFKVEKLVKTLMRQANKLELDFEILCFDDGSRKKFKYENSILSDFFGVNYTELSENLGRARIRNWLAKSASFENLLFLDCDSKIVSNNFLEKYLNHLDEYELISGGRVYSKKPPRAKSKRLHWLYGKKRESVKASKRTKDAVMSFHSNNFFVRRELMMKYPFDEQIKSYGYEDLQWAQLLNENGVRIAHIDNPVEHLGLEKASDFVKKQKKSLENLYFINSIKTLNTKLIHLIDKLERWNLKNYLFNRYKDRLPEMEYKLVSGSPSLLKLQFFKLIYYLKLTKKNI